MKQITLILLSLLLMCCTNDDEVKAATPQEDGKTLVVYYSYTNKCHQIVESLRQQLTVDVMRIEPAEKGLRYEANNYALGTELLTAIQNNPDNASSYPAIDPVSITDLSPYQNIIIVTPLWWSQMAAIMQTYLFHYGPQMAGKHVALIVSSWSSGISGVVADAQRLVKDVTWMGEALWINNASHANRASLIQNWLPTLNFATSSTTMNKMIITIGNKTMTATLVDNSSTRALVEALTQASITYVAHDYGNFEKVGPLGQSFPQNNEDITTVPGDLILYQGSNLCIYYDTNSWDFTRIGKIDNATQQEIKDFVNAGGGDVTVTLSLPTTTGLNGLHASQAAAGEYISLSGVRSSHPRKGFNIREGKKVIF